MEPTSTKLIVLKELAGHEPTSLTGLQPFLAAHADTLWYFWIAVWITTALFLIRHVWVEYEKQR